METAAVPLPKRGGTFFYCPWTERTVTRGGAVTVSWCGAGSKYGGAVPARFRRLAAFRRHYRRAHS